ncbi:copper resistance CopC/CopD family protein [Streptomyces sp. NPDC059255]|uniref:copper resistance CopC/CopD family protein n=1 Tax=Streptomyces sp. NPDC059255 TaxID=3346793 RepID=UPI0036B39D55
MRTPTHRVRRPLTVLALVGAVLALLLAGAGPAAAHAALSGSDPEDAAVLDAAPERVTLTFTESVRLAEGSVRVLSPTNERVNPKPAEHVAGKADAIRVGLRGKLPEGTYTVSWRVISADGHPISGAFVFSVGEPSATLAELPAESPDDTAVTRVYDGFRYVAYGGFALLLGVAVFLLHCWPAGTALRSLRRLLVAGWAALLASTAVLLALRGPYETGGGAGTALDPELLGSTLTGRAGMALGARLLLLAVVGVLLALLGRRFRTADSAPIVGPRLRVAGGVLTLALTVTWAAAEHASAGPQVPLAIPVAVLHLLAMAVWLGGLVALAAALWRAPADAPVPAAAVARFSRLAFTAVAVLVVTGVYQSWRQVGSWQALTSTEYGRTLVVKVVAVLALLVAAAYSRRWTGGPPATDGKEASEAPATDGKGTSGAPATDGAAPRPSAPPGPHRRALRRSVVAEAVLGAVVLAITTVLTGTPPSRAAVETTAGAALLQEPPVVVATVPFDVGTPNGTGKVQLTFDPGRPGENVVEALVFAADGGIAAVPELRLTLTHRAERIGPLDAKLVDRQGYWWTDSLRLPLAGTWTMKLSVRTSELDQVTVEQDIRIRDRLTGAAGG